MNLGEQLTLLVAVSVVLQVIALLLLPKWWKLAACPPLLLMMALELSSGANLAGIMTHGLLAPLAIGWQLIVLVLYGIANAVRSKGAKSDDTASTD